MKTWHLMGYVIAAAMMGGAISQLTNNFLPEPEISVQVEQPDAITAARNCTVLVETESGFGSGVLVSRVDPRGQVRVFVWTAYHVIEDCKSIRVKQGVYLEEHRVAEYSAPAVVLYYSQPEDLALLVVDYPVQPWNGYATFIPWLQTYVGQSIFHVGNLWGPLFLDSVMPGIIGRLNVAPDLQRWPWPFPLDQASMIIIPGSSGGGVFDMDGNCIGLAVGAAGPGVSVYVPLRRIYAWACEVGLEWALVGMRCPAF